MRYAIALLELIALVGLASGAELKDYTTPKFALIDNTSERFADARDCTCQIWVSYGGSSAGGTGTCIASEDGKSLIVTNAHVAEDGNHPITVVHKGTKYRAEYLGGHRVVNLGPGLIDVIGPDLAILCVEAELPVAKIAATTPPRGTPVYQFGFGGSRGQPIRREGVVIGVQNRGGDLLLDTTICSVSGDSGSGVFANGELVGVMWGGYSVALSEVKRFAIEVTERKGLFQRFRERIRERRERANELTLDAAYAEVYQRVMRGEKVEFKLGKDTYDCELKDGKPVMQLRQQQSLQRPSFGDCPDGQCPIPVPQGRFR